MRELLWRPRAKLDIESIALYLGFERRSPQAAQKAVRSIDATIARIRQFPDSGGRLALEGLVHEYRTAHANPYTVFYRFDDEAVTIYRILHQRQDIDARAIVDLADEG